MALLITERQKRRRSLPVQLVITGTLLVLIALIALGAPLLADRPPTQQNYGAVLQAPSSEHLMGTDSLGRSVLSRNLYGGRTSILAALLAMAVSAGIGIPLGMASAYFGGWFDEAIMRGVDALQAFPFLILALVITAALGPSTKNAMIAVGIGSAPAFIRIVRSATLQLKHREYVNAALAQGAKALRIVLFHLLPNIFPIIIVQLTVTLGTAIIAESALSYLGLGTQPPTPSWGSELRSAQGYITIAPWLTIWPGAFIFITVLSCNLFGDSLRNYLDPRKQK